MSENLGGFRSSPVGFAEGLLTFPGMGSTYLSLLAAHGATQGCEVAAGMNPAANTMR
jgi:hypothetical protein